MMSEMPDQETVYRPTTLSTAVVVDWHIRLGRMRDQLAEVAATLEIMQNRLDVSLGQIDPRDLDEEGRLLPQGVRNAA